MRKSKITGSIYKFAKKIVNRFYYAGVFETVLNHKQNNLKNTHIAIGKNCQIDITALLLTDEGGEIILSGDNRIGRTVELQPYKNGLIKIGYGTSIQDRNVILGDVEFGRYCLTAPNVYISSGRHYFNHNPNFYIKDQDELVHSSPELSKAHSKKVLIEDDVWIGINAVIMSGVTIGRGSVIGSNSVVTSDVEPFSIMAGSPAKLIKKRLEFIPKASIKFDNDTDLPNFYKGFFINTKNLKVDRAFGGISTSYSFKSFMDNKGTELELTIKSLKSEDLVLVHHHQEALISHSEFQTIKFKINATNNYHQFNLKSKEMTDENEKYFLVKEIKISA